MLCFIQGNLLDARVDALVNTVNTVGVMGKGIALMFKERFPENFRAYAAACKAGEVRVGEMFVQPGAELDGPRWIINFPTKQDWRHPSRAEWIDSGLAALKDVIRQKNIRSIALPPLGCGNGGLEWTDVRPKIETTLGGLDDVEIVVFEPTEKYQNVAKKRGVEKLTPARALIAELVRRYGLLGIECTIIETQKLAWCLTRVLDRLALPDVLKLRFEANRYGPYSHNLTHLLDGLDGSYLHCDKRLADASPFDAIWFDDAKQDKVDFYLKSAESREFQPALEATDALIDGFQSPIGMEALATVDWLISRERAEPTVAGVREGLKRWPAGADAAARKLRLFDDKLLSLAIERLKTAGLTARA